MIEKNDAAFIREGISHAEITKLNSPPENNYRAKLINKTYEFDGGSINLSSNKEEISNKAFLFEINNESSWTTGSEKASNTLRIKAFDVVSQKTIWELPAKSDSHNIRGDYFIITTMESGCCGASDSYRAYSEITGEFLFSYSFTTKINLPVILRSNAFDPDGFRFVAYHDHYWSSRDKSKFLDPEGKLTLAGILTYASPLKSLQKLAVFYDEEAFGDPSGDPDIMVSYGDKHWVFKTYGQESDYEASYWNRDAKVPELIYSDLIIKLIWGDEIISIPIIHDQFDVNNISVGSKYFKKVIVLPSEYWNPKNN
jgi:hypothetical protein